MNRAKRFGVRWQSGSGDTAFGRTRRIVKFHPCRAGESGVALRFPPQSKMRQVRCGHQTTRSVLECASPLALWAGCAARLIAYFTFSTTSISMGSRLGTSSRPSWSSKAGRKSSML